MKPTRVSANDNCPRVSAVIPTIGRESLLQSVWSILRQSRPVAEVVVAIDLPRSQIPGGLLDSLREARSRTNTEIKVVLTGGGFGANYARNLGVDESSGQLVALLDDDDEWLPGRLELQLQAMEDYGYGSDKRDWLCYGPVVTAGVRSGQVWPKRLMAEGESVGRYLFRGRLKRDKPFIQPSTWLAPRRVFQKFPFAVDVRLHDDFDWLIRSQVDGLAIFGVGDPIARYMTASPDSIVAKSTWHESLKWISDASLPVDRRDRADFVASYAHRTALESYGRRESIRALIASRQVGVPRLATVATSLARTIRGGPRRESGGA